jgi:hypothetical protein
MAVKANIESSYDASESEPAASKRFEDKTQEEINDEIMKKRQA